MKMSIFLISFFSMNRPGSNPFTSPAMRAVNADASKRVIGPIPLFPAVRAVQFSALPIPSGETMPTPVMATRRGEDRRGIGSVLLGVLFDVFDRVFDFGDLLCGFVGNFDVERFLERHHQLDGIKRIRAEIVDEGSFRSDLGGLHAEL